MKKSLRSQLSVSYIMITVICIVLISAFSNFFLERQFQEYVKQNMGNKNEEIVEHISQQYAMNQGWNTLSLQGIGIDALENGLMLDIKDKEGKQIWNSYSYNDGMCQQMLKNCMKNMLSRYPNWKGEYQTNLYPILYNAVQVGVVEIGSLGPFYYNENDLAFLNTLNRVFIAVGLFCLILAFFFAHIMSKRLSTPISRVINTAQMISKGYYGDRCVEESNIKETGQLTETINDLAETLQNQEKLRKRLTADVAHELRTPLATLQSHMEAMIDGIWKPEPERLKSCHEEIVRISRLVGDLEKLARYEGENLILNKTHFNLVELIRTIATNFENEFKIKGVDLAVDTAANSTDIFSIFADRDKMSQVFINLLSNALKYTPESGQVSISASQAETELIIEIKDNGIGVSESDLPNLFERFYRADQSRNRMTGGSGIGLTIAKSIIDAHKGSIQVESTLNEGTLFTIRLPQKKD